MNLEAGLPMRIYEDQQIHTKTGSRPITFHYSRSSPHTNRKAYSKEYHKLKQEILRTLITFSRRYGYCYLNKEECNLNQSKDDSFVERVAKNNS